MLQQRAAVVARVCYGPLLHGANVLLQAQRLILQPQFECEEMRRYLHGIHFTITGLYHWHM
jgi:tRNA A22 N-methylase